eukprot:TRINITY_DN3551_c0_g1_i1.p1 TRINITY_DN3551_c0_g1~~TRINITY_DN3551_c0_g1_i1.p1  ORF type:complete len:119 (+),score=36.68 TRINITY_DN3551_c0_g1_i1:567-923(+)
MMMNDTTLLHTATKAKNKPLIQLLIAFGASKDIESGKPGKKQSLYSATEGDPDIIHCLNHPSFSVDRAIYKMLPQEIREAIFTWLVILKRYRIVYMEKEITWKICEYLLISYRYVENK